MPESCEVYHTREKKKPIFSARFELKVRGRKTIVMIGKFYNKTEQKPLHLNKPPVI